METTQLKDIILSTEMMDANQISSYVEEQNANIVKRLTEKADKEFVQITTGNSINGCGLVKSIVSYTGRETIPANPVEVIGYKKGIIIKQYAII